MLEGKPRVIEEETEEVTEEVTQEVIEVDNSSPIEPSSLDSR